MFTLEEITAAHSAVKSGADFPAYIQKLKQLGVVHYGTFVSDGRTEYFGKDSIKLASTAKYEALSIAESASLQQFKDDLESHQRGMTDYFTFCKDAARSGITKWSVDMEAMTCTYFDNAGSVVLVEQIPSN